MFNVFAALTGIPLLERLELLSRERGESGRRHRAIEASDGDTVACLKGASLAGHGAIVDVEAKSARCTSHGCLAMAGRAMCVHDGLHGGLVVTAGLGRQRGLTGLIADAAGGDGEQAHAERATKRWNQPVKVGSCHESCRVELRHWRVSRGSMTYCFQNGE